MADTQVLFTFSPSIHRRESVTRYNMSQIRQHRTLLIGAGLLVILAGVVAVGMRLNETAPQQHAAAAMAVPPEAAPPRPPQTATAPEKPNFDVVRVSPEGTAVIAGTAAPHQEVVVRDGTQEVGHATAGAAGQWVLTLDKPLQPGAQELTLAARDAAGHESAGQASVLLVVPEPKVAGAAARPDLQAAAQTPLAVLTPATSGAPSRVLQSPDTSPQTGPAASAAGKTGRLDMDVIDYDDHGTVTFAGHAAPNTHVQVYVDNAPVAAAVAGAGSRWSVAPGAIAPGKHDVRVDQLDTRGKVVARVQLPFLRETIATAALAGGRVVVQPGANLWRLARQAYGSGARYTIIYAYNSSQIRNPALIYPGQALVVPAADAPPNP